jgi:hypothetical protein
MNIGGTAKCQEKLASIPLYAHQVQLKFDVEICK